MYRVPFCNRCDICINNILNPDTCISIILCFKQLCDEVLYESLYLIQIFSLIFLPETDLDICTVHIWMHWKLLYYLTVFLFFFNKWGKMWKQVWKSPIYDCELFSLPLPLQAMVLFLYNNPFSIELAKRFRLRSP